MMKKKIGFSAAALALFILLMLLVRRVDVAQVYADVPEIGLSHVNRTIHDALGTHFLLADITAFMGYASLLAAAGFAGLGVWQLIQRRSLMKVDRCLLALGALYVAVAAVYVFFEKFIVNYRPVLMPGEAQAEASFPSSHTMLFCVVLGSAALVIGRYIRRPRLLWAVRAGCILAMIAAVLWRLISGVHWFTDILAGVLISAALLLLFSAALEKWEA